VGIVLTVRAHSEWFMTGSRLSPRQRRGCRAVGASFIAAAALPLFAITPLAQADAGHAGHGGQAAVNQAPVGNHLRAIVRAQAPQAQPAQAGQHQAAKPAQHQAAKPAQQPAKQVKQQPVKPAVKGPAVKAPVAKAAHQPAAKAHASAAHKQQPGSKAHDKVYVCHATNSDTNPYVVIWVSVASVQFQGHLMHQNEPNKTWKRLGTWDGVDHKAGDEKPDIILDARFNPDYDGSMTAADCKAPGKTVTPPDDTTPPDDKTPPSNTTAPTPPGHGGTPPGQGGTPPGQGSHATPPGHVGTNPGAQVLPGRFTNTTNPNSSANAGTNPQVLGEKVSALPRTGADMVGAALLSLLMLTLGGLLLRLSAVRRRRTH
jgi:hypothetical protein